MTCDVNKLTPEEYSICRRQEHQAKLMRQPAPQQSGGMPPGGAQMAQQFMGGGGGAASGGEAAAGGGGEAAGMAGAMWPAALAAVIIGNETWASKNGRRPGGNKGHLKDIATGRVLNRDVDALGSKTLSTVAEMGTPYGIAKPFRKLWDWFD